MTWLEEAKQICKPQGKSGPAIIGALSQADLEVRRLREAMARLKEENKVLARELDRVLAEKCNLYDRLVVTNDAIGRAMAACARAKE